MIVFLKNCIKNIFRNKRRTIMTIAILAVSMAIMFLTFCYLEGMYWALRYGARTATGYVQLAAAGYWDDRIEHKPILEKSSIELLEIELDRLGAEYSYELDFQGLLGNDRDSTIVSGAGIEPQKSGGVVNSLRVLDGRILFASDTEKGLLGVTVAKRLGVVPGDWVTLLGQNLAGAFNPVSFEVAGIVTTGVKQNDAYFCALPLSFAQSMRQTDGVEKVLIFFGSRENTPAADTLVNELQSYIDRNQLPVEMKYWHELSSFYFELKSLYDFIFLFIIIIIMILVLLSVFEITSMSFYERIREIGMLRAIGTTKGEIFVQLMIEVFFLYLIGNVFGTFLGMGIGEFINSLSIQWLPPGSSSKVPFFFDLNLKYITIPLAVTFIASFTAGLLPAYTTSRMSVVEVLRHE